MNKALAATWAVIAVSGVALTTAPTTAAEGSNSQPTKTQVFSTVLSPVPTNHATGSGTARVQLTGNQATVTVMVSGLLAGVPHAAHIHIDGQGRCPIASEATLLNGHRALSTTDGAKAYGKVGASLTTRGDVSPNSEVAVTRFPTGSAYTYKRTFKVTADAAASIRRGNAVVVVHGIDYNGSGKFTNVLGPSELDPKLPQTATAPAICGALRATPS
ncbi:CHRD domain-containing protein [Streptomyces mirabilis]|uniref:CHRD domain-containing protein n=1 Tax=Streptomyces mirabilis TaxID=68239 RepID=UPI0036A07B64